MQASVEVNIVVVATAQEWRQVEIDLTNMSAALGVNPATENLLRLIKAEA